MKKIFYLITLCCAFTACDKTENGSDLYKVFFDSGEYDVNVEKLKNYAYFDGKETTPFYTAIFDNSSAQKPWDEFQNNQFGKGYYMNNAYKVEAMDGHYHPVKTNIVNYEQSRDFQIEFAFAATLGNNYSGAAYAGFVFNTDKNNNGFGFRVKRNYSDGFDVQILKIDENKEIFTSKLEDYALPMGLFTVRKIGNKVSFFKDKKYLFSTDYNYGYHSGIAYTLSRETKMTIDELSIVYLN